MSRLRYIPLTTTVRERPKRALQHLLIKLYDAFAAEVYDAK